MSNRQMVFSGDALGAAAGLLVTKSSAGRKGCHYGSGVLGGALIGALAGSTFKNEVDVKEQPDGTVKLQIPGALMFAAGQHALGPAFQSTLRNVTRTISKDCDITLRVVGHTDNVGAPVANQQLSETGALRFFCGHPIPDALCCV